MKKIFASILICTTLYSCSETYDYAVGDFTLSIDRTGHLSSIEFDGQDYLSQEYPSPLAQLYDGKGYIKPVSAVRDGDTVRLGFSNGSEAVMTIVPTDNHIRMELLSLIRRDSISDFVWGPYGTTISKWIGETICTVRDDDFAFGVWGLNTVTVEGSADPNDIYWGMYIDPKEGQMVPAEMADRIGEKYSNMDLNSSHPEYVRSYRGAGARRTKDGSLIRLHAHDHNRRDTVGFGGTPVITEPIDVDYIGSAVAVIGCRNEDVLDAIEKMELAEGLPHPEIDGVWIKRNPKMSNAYLMYEGNNFDKAFDYADSCGFSLIHIGDAFGTWGKFPLVSKRFPGGAPEIKALTDKARERGISIGMHSLTMFTTVNDGYVTPKADHHLCASAKALLTEDISAKATEITITDTRMFEKPTGTKSIRIGDEIMSYENAKDGKVYGITRGQFGTEVSSHSAGDTVAHLLNNAYGGFYPDIHIEKQYSDRLAEVVKETGIDLLDFDGFDGGHNGHGQYEMAAFARNWYDSLEKGVINCGSNTTQYYWHVYSYMNWGEPWYADLRQSMPYYRMDNQFYMERNLMPGMLGWYSIKNDYRPEDAEWINAKSAGADAGFLVIVDDGIEKSAFKNRIFKTFKDWQDARRHGEFTDKQREDMRDGSKDFHLEPHGQEGWHLTELLLKSGYSTGSSQFENPFLRQPVTFYGYIDSDIRSLSICINGKNIEIKEPMHKGDKVYANGLELHICDSLWNSRKGIQIRDIMWNEGDNSIEIKAEGTEPQIRFDMRASGRPQFIKRIK